MKVVSILPVFVQQIPDKMQQGKLYISEEYECANHLCLCGCGEQTVTPLDPVHGWQLHKLGSGKVSLTPSIGNYQFPCKSHYFITENEGRFV